MKFVLTNGFNEIAQEEIIDIDGGLIISPIIISSKIAVEVFKLWVKNPIVIL